jgi:hypothetical protein
MIDGSEKWWGGECDLGREDGRGIRGFGLLQLRKTKIDTRARGEEIDEQRRLSVGFIH